MISLGLVAISTSTLAESQEIFSCNSEKAFVSISGDAAWVTYSFDNGKGGKLTYPQNPVDNSPGSNFTFKSEQGIDNLSFDLGSYTYVTYSTATESGVLVKRDNKEIKRYICDKPVAFAPGTSVVFTKGGV